MDIILFVIAIVAAGAIGYFIGGFVTGKTLKLRGRIDSARKALQQRQERKERRKSKIMELFNSSDVITNDDVQDAFNFSNRTTTRYLEELEQEEKITQHGDSGRGVFYTKNT